MINNTKNSIEIMVTGANGFIGKRLVNEFLNKGWHIIAVCRDLERLKEINHHNLKVIQYDLEDSIEVLNNKIESVDVICHLAALIPRDLEDNKLAEKCYNVNSLGTLKLMEFGISKNIKRFIYYSSGNAYDYSDNPVNEDFKMYPSKKATYYLASKLIGELYVEHFRVKKMLNATIFRPSSVYGYGMNQNEFIYKSIEKLSNNLEIEIQNDDIYKTDFVYVEDIIKATSLSIERNIDGIFNLGSGNHYSLRSVAKIIANILGKQIEHIKIKPTKDISKTNKGFSGLNMSKTIEVFKYTPTSIYTGLEKMVQDMKKLKLL